MKMEDLLIFMQKTIEDGPVSNDHSVVAGRMVLFNLMKTEAGSEIMEDVFGLAYIRRDIELYKHMALTTSVLAWVLEHGMPEDILAYYSNCAEAILEDLDKAVQFIAEECETRGIVDSDTLAEITKTSGIDIDYIDSIFTPWEPLEDVHVV